MIDMQLLGGILVALAALVGVAIALSLVMLAAGSVTKPGPAPHGGIRRDLPEPQHPQSDTDDARVLVLH
jgi:hypothetical protein